MLDALTTSRRTSPGSTAAKVLHHLPPVLVAVATVWLFFCAAYAELDLPAQGHLGAGAVGNAMVAESMSTHHVWFPSWSWFGDKVPDASTAYCHHPFGIYWSEALMFWVFGTRDWMVSLPAILMSTASPALFYLTFRRSLGRMSAALGAVVFTLVPMEVGMAGFHNLEVPCMFGILLHTACAEHYRERGGRRFFVGALVGAFVTAASCWVGYLYLAPILGGTLVFEFTFRRLRSRGSEAGRSARLWVWTTVVAVLSLVMWVAMYVHLNQLTSWTSAATTRSSGADALDYWTVLERRADWIYIGFQPALIALGVLAIPFVLLRILVRRRTIELVPFALLIGPLVWYRAFNQGAEVHVFWPHQFALYIGAAVTVLAATAREVTFFVLRKAARTRWQPRARLAGVVVFALVPLVLVPDAVRALVMWKDTGGRYDEKGHAFFDDEDGTFLLRSIARPIRRKVHVAFHGSFGNDNWELFWAMRKKPDKFLAPVGPIEGGGLLWMRMSGLSADEFHKMEGAGKVSRYGDVVLADSRRTGSASEAFSIARAPNLWESFVRGAFRPAFTMTNQPEPYATWELREQLGHSSSAPTDVPQTPDQKRIGYNASVVAGAPSSALEDDILDLLDRRGRTAFGAVTLLGTRSNVGPARELELWFRCEQDIEGDHASRIWAEPYARLPWSLVPQPVGARGLVGVPTYPIGTWKAGRIYVIRVRLFRRLAKEHVRFEFVAQGGQQQLGHPGGPITAVDLP